MVAPNASSNGVLLVNLKASRARLLSSARRSWPSDEAVGFIAPGQQELRQTRIPACKACDEDFPHGTEAPVMVLEEARGPAATSPADISFQIQR